MLNEFARPKVYFQIISLCFLFFLHVRTIYHKVFACFRLADAEGARFSFAILMHQRGMFFTNCKQARERWEREDGGNQIKSLFSSL